MKVIIYDMDGVSIHASIDAASEKIIGLYGEKLGTEACQRLAGGRPGTIYRKHGGPRVELISDVEAERILVREQAVMRNSQE